MHHIFIITAVISETFRVCTIPYKDSFRTACKQILKKTRAITVIYGYFYLQLVEYIGYSQMLSINPEIQDKEPVQV